jgi:hypothetical protein
MSVPPQDKIDDRIESMVKAKADLIDGLHKTHNRNLLREIYEFGYKQGVADTRLESERKNDSN